MIVEVESFDLGAANGALIVVSKRWYHPRDLRMGPSAVDFFCRQFLSLHSVDLKSLSTALQGARRYLWNTYQTELHLYVALACGELVYSNTPPFLKISTIDDKGDAYVPEVTQTHQNLEKEDWCQYTLSENDRLWTLYTNELKTEKLNQRSLTSSFMRASDLFLNPKASEGLFLSFPRSL